MIVSIERGRDFGREMSMVVWERGEGNVDYVLVPVPPDPSLGPGFWTIKRIPVREGHRIPEEGYFLRLNELFGQEFLQALVVELSRHGFVTPDPHGTQVSALKEHVSTLHKENDRHYELVNKLVDAVTKHRK